MVNSSGSTGKPKEIKISRKQLVNSSKATLRHFKLKKNTTFLSCLPVKYIGGKMMIIRGIIGEANFVLCKPSVNPIKKLHKEIDFMAITPLQLDSLLKNISIFNKIKLTIVGGGRVSKKNIEQLQAIPYECYQTYGMTETVSHIAVRNLKNQTENNPYICLENNYVTTNYNNQLVINSKYLNISSLTTNDIAKVTGNKYFTINGRVDNIINSGGYKVSSEKIEELIYKNFENKLFFIDKIKCDKLGEKIILIAEKEIKLEELIISIQKIKDRKKRPKEIYFTNHFFYNENQKIDRTKTKKNALSNNIVHKLN